MLMSLLNFANFGAQNTQSCPIIYSIQQLRSDLKGFRNNNFRFKF